MVQIARFIAARLGPPAPRYRIAVLDQRGTGANALDCPELQSASLTDFTVPPPGSVEQCGAALGDRRGLFPTTATVEDLESVRAALGVERMAIYGVSYGTYVAERYASAHPDRVTHLVLDSVVPQEDVNPLLIANLGQAGKILRRFCRAARCRGIARAPARQLHRLVVRMANRPLTGRVRVPGGGRATVRLDGPGLIDLMTTLTSFQQQLFSHFPAAVASARKDDPRMLLRLAAVARISNATESPAELSWGLHTATLCSDVAFPWGSPSSDPSRRAAAVAAAASAIPDSEFLPFDRATATGNGVIETCRRFPPTDVAPPPAPRPLPGVPILILSGTFDLSTPISDARREAVRSPTARLAKLPEVGHATLLSAGCAQEIVKRFFAARELGEPCKRNRAPDPVRAPARRVSDVPGRTRARRARAVALATLADAKAIAAAIDEFTGLRGGSFRISGGRLRLDRDELVRGAPVSGKVKTPDGPGRLRVRGRLGATVRIDKRGRTAVHVR
jgi:pimeloyl-ACP methyl ester carboxylesterase